jgi:LacI family transcriptional regulator
LMGLGVIKAAKYVGRKVPEDLSIIGYDDILLASYSSPPLTTIAQDKFHMGYEAGKLLVQMLEGNYDSNIVKLETQLKIRNTTTQNHK